MRWIRLAPVTAESLIVSVAIYVSCLFQSATSHESLVDVQRGWGAIRAQDRTPMVDGVRRGKEVELVGPLDIWDGEWWRIPMAPFHNTSMLQLVLCVGATWYLGSRLERAIGSFPMGLFLIPSLSVPVIAELLFGHDLQGMSGVICVLLGAISVLRQDNAVLSAEFPEEIGEFGVTVILLGWLATLFGAMSPLPNAAHIVGFLYGFVVATMSRPGTGSVHFMRISLVLTHLWLVPSVYYAAHPFWLGRYHWYRAVIASTASRTERNLERAIRWDSSLSGAWLHWSEMALDRGQPIEAWRRVLQGLHNNPSDSVLMDGGRRLWRHMNSEQRREAETVLAGIFGAQSKVWLEQIRAITTYPVVDSLSEQQDSSEPIDLKEFQLDQRQELPRIDLSPTRLNRRESPPNGMPNDASEGAVL